MWAGRKTPVIEGQPLTPTTWPLLVDGQTERTLMHNEYITARQVCHGLWITAPPPASFRPLPQSPAVANGESLRHLAAFPLSCVCHSCHIHSLSQVICVHVALRHSLAVSLSHKHARPPTGGVDRLEIWTDVDLSVECQCCHGGMTGLSIISGWPAGSGSEDKPLMLSFFLNPKIPY